MRVEIESVAEGGADVVLVAFRCVHGGGVAAWRGPPAVAGAVRFVELELDHEGPRLLWGVTAWDLGPGGGPASIRGQPSSVEVVAEVVSVWPEGPIELQLGGNARLVVELAGDAPRPGAWLRLRGTRLWLYDCDL